MRRVPLQVGMQPNAKKFRAIASIKPEDVRLILVGAEDQLPARHVWFEGAGYWIYAAEQPRSSWREHTHDWAQITIGLEPAHVHAEWRTGTKPLSHRELSGNMVSIIPPDEPHLTLWQRRASLIHIYLSTEILAKAATEVLRQAVCPLRSIHLVRDPFIEELGRALYRECHTAALSSLFTDSLVTVLATHLLRTYRADSAVQSDVRGGLGPARERRIREYIEESLDGDLSIHTLAHVAGISPNYFASAFHQTTGFTPHQYVSHRRIERAQQLLTEADLPIAEVAYRCGFASQSQFTTLFRRFTGVTPGRFRAS